MTLPKFYQKAHKAYRLRYHGNTRKVTRELRDAMTRILRGDCND